MVRGMVRGREGGAGRERDCVCEGIGESEGERVFAREFEREGERETWREGGMARVCV